ncbi:MAG TPA: HEAT repeat domain-containing protein [Methanolinea sp.]|nr:HEAT repeat domain-containing protein [Methanolinea sp.]
MAFSDLHLNRMDRFKLAILLSLVALSVALEAVVHHAMGIEVVYSHFFYIPVVLGAVWYGKRGVLVAVFLAAVYVGDYFLIGGAVPVDAWIRALMFVVVAVVIGTVMDYVHREQEQVMTQMANAALREGTSGRFRGNLDEWKAKLRSSVNVKRLKDEKDARGLIEALRHRDPAVQYEAAEALGVLREPTAVTPLMAALTGDRYSGVRWKAAEALARIGSPAVEPLIGALGNPDEDVRWKAAIALGEIGDPRAIPPLIALLEDHDRFVQSRAAFALGQFGNTALSPLLIVLQGGSPAARRGAAIALGKIGGSEVMDPLLTALSDPDEAVRASVLDSLGCLGEGVHARLLAYLGAASPDERSRVFQALREATSPRFAEGFFPVLSLADDETREVILSLARKRGEKQTELKESGDCQ